MGKASVGAPLGRGQAELDGGWWVNGEMVQGSAGRRRSSMVWGVTQASLSKIRRLNAWAEV
jgi:hypothetical protein